MKEMGKRELILESFFDLVAEKGYAAASMNDITKRSGVSKGAIYHYFSSKEELFVELIKYVFGNMINNMEFSMEGIDKKNYRQFIKNIGMLLLQQARNNEKMRKFQQEFFAQAIRSEMFKDILQGMFHEYRGYFEQMFMTWKDQGIVNKNTDIKLLSTKVFIVLDAIMLYDNFEMDFDLEGIMDSFLDDILQQIEVE